jgi:soluble lytic murein transglycosylase
MILAVSVMSQAKVLTLDFFNDKPKSLTKDFYISQFLDQGCSDAQATKLLPQVKNLNAKLFKKFAPHIDDMKRKAYCQNLKSREFIGKSEKCIQIGLSLYKATKLPSSLLETITTQIVQNPSLAAKYLAISSKKFDNLIKLPPKLLLETFNNVGSAFRETYYDHPLPKNLIPLLIQEKGFNTMIEKVIRGNFPKLQKSFVHLDSLSLSAESNFLLALNAIRYGQLQQAVTYLNHSEAKATFTFEKDKALFWNYLLTHDKTILSLLTQSKEINIYSLYAFETLGKFPTNIRSQIEPKVTGSPLINITDPFAWIALKKRVKAMHFSNYEAKKQWLMQYNTPQMEPHISRLLYRYKNNLHDYLMPYTEYLKESPLKRKILIFSLARQESHFIPTEVSYSYALGMMQFMPFVAKDIAKKHKIKNFQYEDMFKPEVAYRFANIQIDFLERSVRHPLYIAYAYNAGIGFTKREIRAKGYFKKGAYEPFWSLEMVPNAQARKYGKRVLANYTIYAKLLGEDITLHALLKTIK